MSDEPQRIPSKGWKERFIAILALNPNATAAAAAVGVSRTSAYTQRRNDPDFAEAWDAAVEESTDALVGEAYRRAVHGYKGPDGELRFSDTLLIFLLKCHRRAVYGDRFTADVNGEGFKTVLYLPDNSRDGYLQNGQSAPATGPANGVHDNAG